MSSARHKNRELVARFTRWLLLQQYSPITREMYARSMRDYLRFLGGKFVMKSNHMDVQEFLASEAAKGVRPRTVLYKLYAVRVFFDFLCLGGLVKWSPPRVVQIRSVERNPPKVLTEEEVKRLLEATQTPHERALLEVLYGTGCRTDEVRTMLVEDIDFVRNRIRVTGKAGVRFVMFSPRVERSLRAYISWKRYDREGSLVASRNGFISGKRKMTYQQASEFFKELAGGDRAQGPVGDRPLCHAAIQKTVQKIGLRAGLAVTPRSFRHTFATHLLDNGADLGVVQELMGHTSIASTQIYAHVSKGAGAPYV